MTGMISEKRISLGLFLLCPAVGYGVFEWITGSLFNIQGKYLVMNLLFFYMFYLILFAAAGSVRFVWPALNALLTCLALAEYFVLAFRARPIMLWDVMAFQTALTVSGNYQYRITPRAAAGILVMAAVCFLLWKFPFRIRGKKLRAAWAVAAAVFTAGYLKTFYGFLVPRYEIDISMWAPEETYGYMGYALCTMRSLEYLYVKPPEGYSEKEVRRAAEELEEWKRTETPLWKTNSDTVPTNLICIMNESFSDLKAVGDFDTDLPYLPFYDSLEENCVKGRLYMPVFGSMTPNSEYEFLTGNSMAYAPSGSVPYQTYMREPVYGLVSTLKAQGFRTVAMHPYNKQNWNRVTAYGGMGFDEFLGEEYYEGADRLRGYVSDRADYEKIVEMTEHKEPGQRLFIFNVTMQNHGGYEDDYQATVHLKGSSAYPKTEQYLSLIRESDRALRYLLDYYEGIEEPTMVVMFGDHQPSVEPEFYESLYRAPLTELKPEDYARRFITPFLVWTNYDTKYQYVERMSAQYLGGMMLERANLEVTDYQIFLDQMYRTAPVVHMLGYYGAEGQWESWTNWSRKKEYPVLQEFGILQHNNLFGGSHRVDALFSLSP